MIQISIYRDALGHIRRFEVKGHAEAGALGEDLVCCAVSVVVQTAVMGLTDILGIKPQYWQKSGWVCCVLPPDMTDEERKGTGIILETMLIGLKSIQLEHKKYISIKEGEVE